MRRSPPAAWRTLLALLLAGAFLLPACGRKAKPQPRWGKAAPATGQSQTR